MLTAAEFFLDQAKASPHIHFIYDLTAQRVVFVNEAYEQVLEGNRANADDELPALLARLHPDQLSVLHSLWQLWKKGALDEEVELQLVRPGQPDQWLCLAPHWHQNEQGHVWLGHPARHYRGQAE